MCRRRIRQAVIYGGAFAALMAASLCGCTGRHSVTMNLEEVSLNQEASAVVQTMNEYQVTGTKKYLYQGLGDWLDANRTVSIYGSEPGKIIVFTKNEDGDFQWRDVYYAYSFYDEEYLAGRKAEGGSPLMISPFQMSSDGSAVAYQVIEEKGQFIAVSERGKETVFLNGKGEALSDGEVSPVINEGSWNQFEYCWSSDGRFLLYYRMGELVVGPDEEEMIEWQEKHPEETLQKTDVLLLPYGVYGYDRKTGQVQKVWEPMRLNMPAAVSRNPASASVVADADGSQAAMFLLFDDDSGCPDVQLWYQEGKVETRLLTLPENPCIQMVLKDGIYYYQEDGEVRKAPLGKQGQSESVVYTDPNLKTFLVSEDGKRVFTIEDRGDTDDICLYIRDEKQNWYKQIVYVGASGALSLQLSENQQHLLVECRGENGNQALVLSFYDEEE